MIIEQGRLENEWEAKESERSCREEEMGEDMSGGSGCVGEPPIGTALRERKKRMDGLRSVSVCEMMLFFLCLVSNLNTFSAIYKEGKKRTD